MRIGIVCAGSYVGGTEVVALTLARGLRSRGHDARMLANAWTNGDFPQRLRDADVPYEAVHMGKFSLTLRPPYAAWTAAALARLPSALSRTSRWLRSLDPEVVLLNNRDSALFLAPVLRRRTTVFYMHESWAVTRHNRLIVAGLSRAVDHFIAVCDAVRSRLIELGVSDSRITVIHNGAICSSSAPPLSRINARPLRVGIVGQIAELKGHEDLLASVAMLRKRGLDIRCVIVGKGDPAYTAHLRDVAEQQDIADHVEWLGFRSDLTSVFASLDVAVVPSRCEEAFPMAAVEACLAALPVVATNSGGLPEAVVDGVSGFVVPRRDVAGLASAIERLYHDGDLRVRFGAAAREHAVSHFTAERMVDGVEELCHTLPLSTPA